MTRKRKPEAPLYKLPITSDHGHISGVIMLDDERYKDWELKIAEHHGIKSFIYNSLHFLNKIAKAGVT